LSNWTCKLLITCKLPLFLQKSTCGKLQLCIISIPHNTTKVSTYTASPVDIRKGAPRLSLQAWLDLHDHWLDVLRGKSMLTHPSHHPTHELVGYQEMCNMYIHYSVMDKKVRIHATLSSTHACW
jgi:hypothetical protein